MKPKISEEPRVISRMVSPGGALTQEQLESQKEERARVEAQRRIEALNHLKKNKLAKFLDAKVLITDWTHPCLYDAETHRQGSVSEFYPHVNLAVDKFYVYEKADEVQAKKKKAALNAAGFKYVALTPQKDMADAWAECEAQGLKVA